MKRNLAAASAISFSILIIASASFAIQACGGMTDDHLGVGPFKQEGSVTTYHNNQSRDGNYPYETELTLDNVTATSFGKIGALPVDGVVYGQPLVARNVKMGDGTTKDIVLVATEHDSIYAFDAQSLSTTPLWRNNFVGDKRTGVNDVTASCGGCSTWSMKDTQIPNISPELGITATPVLDPNTGVLYVVATSKVGTDYHMQLHALDITTGAEQGASPVEIRGSYPGKGTASLDGTIFFDAKVQLSRSGLALVPAASGGHPRVMFGFSSFDDHPPARGWFFAYDGTTLEQTGTFVTTPDSELGAIWMAGGAPAIDSDGNAYFATANGNPNNIVVTDFAESIVKLGFDVSGFFLQDFFTPDDRVALDGFDIDVGSGGVMLLPDQTAGNVPHLLVQGGKDGTVHLLNRDTGKMGGRTNVNGARLVPLVQNLTRLVSPEQPTSNNTGLYSTPTYWNGRIYLAAIQSSLRSFALQNGLINPNPVSVAKEQITQRGASTSVSSSGSANGIIWLIDDSAYSYTGWDAKTFTISGEKNGPAILYAYDPDDLSTPLYASNAQGSLDTAGNAAKFAVPTIAGGHVYVATQTEISVYGLLKPRTVPSPTPTPLPPGKLSETGFFTDLATLAPVTGLIEYKVNSQLWSDNATKRRWLKLPAGQKIGFSPLQPWTFPVGTQIIKHFAIALFDGTTRKIETRVLTYGADGWSGVTYQWTPDQSDAVLLVAGGYANYIVPNQDNPSVSVSQNWHFPSANECMSCHTSIAGYALGVNTRQLNANFDYATGTQNQLTYFNQQHLFTQDIGDPAQYGSYTSVGNTAAPAADRARSYLATNCAFCHQPGGPTDIAMDFRAETALEDMNVVNITPDKGNGGVAGAHLLTPGDSATSMIWIRMHSATSGRMPPLASLVVDQTASKAVADWIDGLPPENASAQQKKPVYPPLGSFKNGQLLYKYLPKSTGKH